MMREVWKGVSRSDLERSGVTAMAASASGSLVLSAGFPGVFPTRSALRQNPQQRPQVAFIVAPAANRAGEQRLAYLPGARSQHRSFGLMEVEAGGLPIEVEELEQAPALAL